MDVFKACVSLPDAFMQLSVPDFEFPRSNLPSQARFIGALPIAPGSAPIPGWAADLEEGRKIVLVTQGTVDNQDFGQLIAPALDALAGEENILVIVTLGGALMDRLRKPWPANARIASFLPFDWLLPKVDVVITNGGYGTVNQALSFGIPLVTAGRSGDKGEVNVRVAWSGVGVDLKTDGPEPSKIREAVRTVLDGSTHRERDAALADEFALLNTRSFILDIVAHHGQWSALANGALPKVACELPGGDVKRIVRTFRAGCAGKLLRCALAENAG